MSNSRSSTSPEPGSGGNNQRNPEPGQNSTSPESGSGGNNQRNPEPGQNPTSPESGSGGNNQRNPEPGQNPNDSTGNPAANSTTTPQPAAPTNIPGVRTTATVVTRNTTPTADDLANKRLLKEIKELNESPVEGVAYATPQKNNLFLWDVAFFGAPDTPYQGGYFKVRSSV